MNRSRVTAYEAARVAAHFRITRPDLREQTTRIDQNRHHGDTLSSSRKRLCSNVPLQSKLSNILSRATNKAAVRGVTVLNQTDDKSRTLNRHNLLIFAGESGDTIQFAEYVQANVQLYGMRHEIDLNSDAVAAFTRRQMSDNLRTRVFLTGAPY